MRTLHTSYRVSELATSLAFYTTLGYEEVGRVHLSHNENLVLLKFPEEEVVTLELDRRRLARFHPSRTPHEYVMEPALSVEARREMHQLVQALYRYVFAGVPCDAADYEAWHRQARVDRYAPAN